VLSVAEMIQHWWKANEIRGQNSGGMILTGKPKHLDKKTIPLHLVPHKSHMD